MNFTNRLQGMKSARAKMRAYGDGGTVDALESARDYLREKYNNPEASIPTKVATTLGLIPVNLARSAAKAFTAPARSMTDENFNPEEEAANMAGFITTGGIGLSKAGLGPKGDVLGMGVSGESKPPIPVGGKKNIYDFDARLAAKEEAEDRPFLDYGSRLQGENIANEQIKATPYKDEEIKRFLHPNIFDNPEIDHYKLGQHIGAVKSWLENPNAQQFVNMPDQMMENYVNSMKKAEDRLFNDGDLSQNAIDRTRRNSKVRKEAISLREQYNQMRDRIGLQPWDTVKADDTYTGHKAGDIAPWAWSQGWDYAKKSAANMAEKSVTSNDLINMAAIARKIPKPINKARGGKVEASQRALGNKLFGLG